MKKLLLVLLLFTLSFGLAACEKEEIEEEFVIDVPDEVFINVQTLPYAEYLSLNNPVVTITVRDMGDIVIQLFPEVAPNTVNNFIAYIQSGAYIENEFHRVVTDFMIQGGKVTQRLCTIEGEMTNNGNTNDLTHSRGVISMARLGGLYDSASSQFFIVHQSANFLNEEYASFGGMVSGFNVLDYIANLENTYINADGNEAGTELPIFQIVIESITVELNGISYDDPVCMDSRLDGE